MSNYALNTEMAREGAGSLGGRIRETGKYIGVIEWAREVTFDSGAVAVELKFRSVDDQTAQLKMFVSSPKSNEPLYGIKQLNAVMACAKVRVINGSAGSVELWDSNAKAMVITPSTVFKELAGKPIGFLLQKEIYEHQGQPRDQMLLFAPFTSDTEQTAREVLDNKGLKGELEKLCDGLKDKVRQGTAPVQQHQAAGVSGGGGDFDDDIPFNRLSSSYAI